MDTWAQQLSSQLEPAMADRYVAIWHPSGTLAIRSTTRWLGMRTILAVDNMTFPDIHGYCPKNAKTVSVCR
ncbi:hypothetical protein M378DRAFT_156443 [Amanita muscaria Koide BX008]|uniref:Uncharacterized protein n=1 Tax=Amanita muscaria (strain Koide BX008) TaxID=946122 RepID=A0A0C2XMF9_AMAMK|nr:hypothetical protein M378DRAFT_156443 [Amanita muscaria Koide BX008]